MRVRFSREGGFAGIPFKTEVDTASLSAEEAERVNRLVEEANFFELPSVIAPRGPGVDRVKYAVTIEQGGEWHTVQTGDEATPPSLRPLLNYLTGVAKAR